MHPQHKSKISSAFILLAAIIGMSFLLIGGLSFEKPADWATQSAPGQMGVLPTQTERDNLQLVQIPFTIEEPSSIPATPGIEPTGAPQRRCQMGEDVTSCSCPEGTAGPSGRPMIHVVYCPNDPPPPRMFGAPFPGAPMPGSVFHRPEREGDPGCRIACFDKPVIYLYPETQTRVDVTLEIPGTVIKSDPSYNNGWFGVIANPDGSLLAQNQLYNSLFYETSVTQTPPKPQKGILLSSNTLPASLKTITTKLGLQNNEQKEFLEYWVPRLQKLQSPYIFFSVYTKEEKDQIDKVIISPKPDTFIEILAYFKPVYEFYIPDPLELPETPPSRNGFTAVEWGGTVDTN